MKLPSRYMPMFQEKPAGVWEWVFLVFLLGLVLWLVWEAPYLLLLVPVFYVMEFWDRRKRRKYFCTLLRERQNDSICSFSRYFEVRKIDTWIIRAVFEQIQNYLKGEMENFPVRPTDDVFIDLKIDDEDFKWDIVEEIAQRTGRSIENAESNPYYGKANIVENLVYFFNAQPKTNAT